MLSIKNLQASIEDKEILNGLNSLGHNLLSKEKKERTAWTNEIKQFFLKYFKSKNSELTVCFGGNDHTNKDCGEWLYDISALKLTDDCEDLISVDTIIESEWGNETDIKEDFQKLLQAKAKHKIMICQASDDNPFIYIKEILECAINHYNDSSDKECINLFCWENGKNHFTHEKLTK